MSEANRNLEYITKFVDRAARFPRAAQFALQAVARELLRDSRIKICCRYRVPEHDVEIWQHCEGERQTAYYAGLMRCGLAWVCPICSARLSEKRRQELGAALDNARDKYIPVLITYTVQHNLNMRLKPLLAGMTEAYRKMRQTRLWRLYKEEYLIEGECRTVEITYGELSGWHPHFHVLVFVNRGLMEIIADENGVIDFENRLYNPLRQALTPLWIESLGKMSLTAKDGPGLHVRGDFGVLDEYLTKGGTALPRAGEKWGVKEEMTKAGRKKSRGDSFNVWDMLLLYFAGNPVWGTRFLEYYEATKGRSMMQWTPGMLAKLNAGFVSDDTIMDDHIEPGDLLLLRLTSDMWRVVLEMEAQGRLLDEAQTGEWEKITAFLVKIGVVPEMVDTYKV